MLFCITKNLYLRVCGNVSKRGKIRGKFWGKNCVTVSTNINKMNINKFVRINLPQVKFEVRYLK